jgi:hypothetical protein
MEDGTVKQFLNVLDEMRTIYAFKDEETRICTLDPMSRYHNRLTIMTKDEKTGINISMSKELTNEV